MGLGETVKGAVKEKAGQTIGNEHLEKEGKAQNTKGDEETRETKERAEAKAHEKKADALEQEQEALES